MINSILVICVGNICRSPMAEAILQCKLKNKNISSAGIGALVNHPADPFAQELMRARNLDISMHRARQISQEICRQSDMILTMEANHKAFVESRFPATRGKVFMLGQFDKIDIPDPYQQDMAAFEYALGLIEKGVTTWSMKLAKL